MNGPTPRPGQVRLASIDAYRGFVMFLMMAEALRLGRMASNFPDSGFWAFLAHHQSHIEWVGCTLHDLIQPSFSFLVGTALAFSVANRQARGQPFLPMFWHAVWRALALSLLGIFLRSVDARQTNFTFEDTLTQIGMGYVPLFLLAFRPRRDQWLALGILLAGVWLAFAMTPVPGPEFDYSKVGVSSKWLADHGLRDFAAHWQKNSNLAWEADLWWMNLFPRETPWTHNGGGYSTLSFVPTLATMLLGLLAGGILRNEWEPKRKLNRMVMLGIAGLALGALAGWLGICPVVKRIWTPSWVLFSGGWCFLFLAAFYAIIDVQGHKRWAFPLVVIGMNSIMAYCIAHLWEHFVVGSFKTHLGQGVFAVFGDAYVPVVQGTAVLAVFWVILHWMHRRQIFLRI
ncbi:MAG: acyltransferase family protein [Limisphaerales bacterium]